MKRLEQTNENRLKIGERAFGFLKLTLHLDGREGDMATY